MREYWTRASVWSWNDAKTRVALLKAFSRILVSLAGAAAGWAIFGIGKPKDLVLVAVCAVAANVLALPAVYMSNLVFRAPVALDAARAETEAALESQIYELSGYFRAFRSKERREDDLRLWIAAHVKKTRDLHMWLTQIVPAAGNFKEYIEPLREWAGRAESNVEIESEDPSGDLKFKITRPWFDLGR